MIWDYAEGHPLSDSPGSLMACITSMLRGLASIGATMGTEAEVRQVKASSNVATSVGSVVSADPPYYDNVGYADLSDFFYVWLRRNLSEVWPDECSTLATPKVDELIADPTRHGGNSQAKQHFESGMSEFMSDLALTAHQAAPATIYYAFKATEDTNGEARSTGWDTFLQAVVDADLQVTATWPMRTERPTRLRNVGSNALASSIVLACRPRPASAVMATRGEFIAALRTELPEAVHLLQSGNIAPVDMAQSTIGPGIKVFSRYSKVVEADGSAMRMSAALSIINDVLGEVLDGEEAELDRDTRFALTWFAEHQYGHGSSGDAESVAKAKNTSLEGLSPDPPV